MKKFSTLFLLLSLSVAAMANFYVAVNGTDHYLASPTGEADYQGREQFAATCVALKANDVLTCFDSDNNASWAIMANDTGETWGAPGFTVGENGLTCSIAGTYNIYIKLYFEDDVWYIEVANNCTETAKPVTPETTPVTPPSPENPNYTTSAPAQYPGVMLQAFYWDSYTDKGYGRTKWYDFFHVDTEGAQSLAGEIGQWFDLVWLPPSAKSSGGTGYLPQQYANQSSTWGTKPYLAQLIDTLHQNGARVIADMVVNHIASTSGWCTLAKEDFSPYGTFTPTMEWICNTDEAKTGSHCTSNFGGYDDGYGSEANYEAGRDWDHNQQRVRDMMNAYAKWMINVVGYDGFRYDYCKGFHNSHINEYNVSGKAFFSVMEMWDGNPDVLISHLNDAGYNTTTFDFGTKYEVFNNGIASDNYYLQGKGLLGRGKGRYAVTFVDSHDSFQRDDNEFCGKGNSMKYKDKLMQCNAYLLAMPGTPCVFYPHWVTFKADLKKLINARYKTGVHNESAVSDEAGNGYYKATITGTNGQLRLLLGPNSGYGTAPSGFTLAAKGTNWGVYYKENTPRGNKNEHRTPIVKGTPDAVETVEEVQKPRGEKVLRDGQLYLVVDGVEYDMMGRRL